MGEHLGLYKFPYENGYFAINLYKITGIGDTTIINKGDTIEGSVCSVISKNGEVNEMGITKINGSLTFKPTYVENTGYGFYNGTNLIFSLATNSTTGFGYQCLGIDDAGNYYYTIPPRHIYPGNIPNSYELSVTSPSNGKAGYFVINYKEISKYTFNNKITDATTIQFLKNNLTVFIKDNDPYNKGGNTQSAGGGGTFGGGNTIFGGNSDSIDIPPLPTASASSAGFITLFNPSLTQLNNLANYMWSDLFSLDTFKKIFADPMDCILGLSIVPVKPASAGTSAVKIGNVSTDVSMNKTSSQYVAVDCGTIDVKEYWGAYLDYAPYTQCEIYLPYVGTKQISVDDVMNKAVHVVYHVDILSGACNTYVKCGDSVLYTFVGQCSSSIPISGNDWTNVLNGAISVAGKIGLAMATSGATALMSGLGAASSIISSSKPTVERSGAMSSTGGLLGIQKPYLILTRPKQALPENQNKYTGYPAFITMALSDCTGYTEIDSIHLENMMCTDEEAQEIENLLKSGVIF